ncbi:hypothetical protein Pan97_16520 [Bremerella volcania]|uniref:VWA-like domain-containing protein n=1 Tax=Bremerella volcania TaxID=2527984 RepID=A0A518C5Y7_9BACT|nr:VWA-like domain-containing protein [Bremerella volcania]QDU74640.1 hypothetical protein Pan97_16520 [Bremerella volcania]
MKSNLEKYASGLLKIAVRRMAKSYPFHAHLLLPEKFVCVPEVETMGVTIRDARLQFWYSPEFVCRCHFDELIGVLHHEVNHLLFGHLLVQPDEFPDQSARVIAEEVSVNEWIVEPLPGNPIKLEQFPELPPLEDTATRYARLLENSPRSGRKPVRSAPKTVQTGRELVQSGQKTPSAKRKIESSDDKISLSPLDNHEIWENARQNPHLGKLVIANAVRQAREALSKRDWDDMSDCLRDQIEEILVGKTSMNKKESIRSRPGIVSWTHMLRQLIAKTMEYRPALHRAPRRFPHLVGIVPGKSQTIVRHKVMAVIDTSASMTFDLLEQIGGELCRLSRECDVTIVECDSEIRSVYHFRGELTEVHGRGGTDLRPPFEPALLAQVRPEVIVYFTDGEGIAPTKPPAIPTIWCLIGAIASPTTWGHQIYVEP